MMRGDRCVLGVWLVLAIGCGGKAKALQPTAIAAGAPTVDQPRRCNGKFNLTQEITITREAAPAAPAKSYNANVHVDGKTATPDNVTLPNDSQGDSSTGNTITLPYVNGALTDTCKNGTLQITVTSTSNVAPAPGSQLVTVPSLGYQIANANGGNGNPLKFRSTIDVKNCAAGAVNFTLTASPRDNVAAAFTFTPASPVNIAAGASQTIKIDGAKLDEHKSGLYTLTISAPAPAVDCSEPLNVE